MNHRPCDQFGISGHLQITFVDLPLLPLDNVSFLFVTNHSLILKPRTDGLASQNFTMDRKAGGGGAKGNSSVNDENKQPSQNANGRKRQDKRSDVKKEDSSQPAQAKGAPQATKEQMRMAQVGRI